jgi:hypothetical protein
MGHDVFAPNTVAPFTTADAIQLSRAAQGKRDHTSIASALVYSESLKQQSESLNPRRSTEQSSAQ